MTRRLTRWWQDLHYHLFSWLWLYSPRGRKKWRDLHADYLPILPPLWAIVVLALKKTVMEARRFIRKRLAQDGLDARKIPR